jgi:hypothetical protein
LAGQIEYLTRRCRFVEGFAANCKKEWEILRLIRNGDIIIHRGGFPPLAEGDPPGNLGSLNSELSSKENPLTSALAAMYPAAFAMAMRFYSRSGLALQYPENADLGSTIIDDVKFTSA